MKFLLFKSGLNVLQLFKKIMIDLRESSNAPVLMAGKIEKFLRGLNRPP